MGITISEHACKRTWASPSQNTPTYKCEYVYYITALIKYMYMYFKTTILKVAR